VVASALNAGASSSPPSLRSAMPLAVPLISSSNLDCSQVRVPSARAIAESAKVEKMIADSKASVLPPKSYLNLTRSYLINRLGKGAASAAPQRANKDAALAPEGPGSLSLGHGEIASSYFFSAPPL